MAMRATVMRHLGARATKAHWPHRIVMAAVIAIALLAAPVFLSPISPGAVPAPSHETITITPPVVDDLVIQSTGYLEFDWSAAEGGVPGFALLPNKTN